MYNFFNKTIFLNKIENYILWGTLIPNKDIDDFITLAVCCDKATRKLIIDGESAPNIDVDW
mgnify:CR=1 FL=1